LTFILFCITVCIMNMTVCKTNEITTSARLPLEIRNRLIALSRAKKKTMSEIIIEALELYYEQDENDIDSFTLGLPYFGKYNLGEGDLSATYKERIREMLRARQDSY